MDVCCECCVLSGRGLCDELITRPEESYWLWCVVCYLETSWMRRPWPTGGGADAPKTNYVLDLIMSNEEPNFPIGTSVLLSRIRELCSCDLGPKTGHPDRFVGFFQFLHTHRTISQSNPRPLSFRSFPIHCSLNIVPFDAVHSELLTASLHNFKTNIWICYIYARRSSPSPAECAHFPLDFLTPTCYSLANNNIGHTSLTTVDHQVCPTRYLHGSESFLRS